MRKETVMKRMRTFLIACVVCGLSIGGFLTGRATAQQDVSREESSDYQFPLSWGTFKAVVPQEGGYVYFFEAADGSIRTAQVSFGNPKGGTYLRRILVTQRSGNAPQDSPRTPR